MAVVKFVKVNGVWKEGGEGYHGYVKINGSWGKVGVNHTEYFRYNGIFEKVLATVPTVHVFGFTTRWDLNSSMVTTISIHLPVGVTITGWSVDGTPGAGAAAISRTYALNAGGINISKAWANAAKTVVVTLADNRTATFTINGGGIGSINTSTYQSKTVTFN